jgi:hypothetical protein
MNNIFSISFARSGKHFNYIKFFWAGIMIFISTAAGNPEHRPADNLSQQKTHSLALELRAFYDISLLPDYLDNTISGQVSSWDTTGGNDDGFSGKYSFLNRNSDSSLVIFDKKGSGVINRIWTPTPTVDTLDFYIDNAGHPTFSVSYIDLFSGKKFPFVAPLCGNQLGGYYCYLPIPFENSCKIVSRGKKMQFHQVQYRMYDKKASVKSFNPDLNQEEKNALEKIISLWNKDKKTVTDFYPSKLQESLKAFQIKPGETISLIELNQGGRILGIEFKDARIFEGLAKSLDIRITWDDELNPAIDCPAADFFGYAFGKASMSSLLLGSDGTRDYCYFPMPFDNKAKIEIIYRKDSLYPQDNLQLTAHIWYSTEKRVPEKEGKFYAHWNKNIRSQPGQPHIFLNVKGRGHYVGTILQAQGKKAGMTYFFEGDDSTSIDGSFRIHGTGSEDYFNGGWYAMMDRWDGKMSLPLHGALDYSLPFCRTGGYRFYISDKLSFEKSIFQSIEHGPVGNLIPVDYTSLALYYSGSPVGDVTLPTNELSHVFLPDTLIMYPQLMDYNIYGNIDIKTTWKYGTGGESYLFTPAEESWLRISLADIPDGKYRMSFDILKGPTGCDFSLWQRQTQISDWVSTYNPVEKRETALYVCNLNQNDFIKTLTIRFKTDYQKSSLLLNRITLIKIK